VVVKTGDAIFPTGLRMFGAVIGDRAEIGCNAVLSPGSIVGRDSIIYPCTNARGVIPARSIVKNRQAIEIVPRDG
jgi:acetyltransferase-like isoleucine patch superfamily enzyme